MRIAVTYEKGNVFQHFGKTENFKVYEVEDKHILSAEVRGTNGVGHEAIADLLKEWGVDVLLCGGLGGGAMDALKAAGIEMVSGAEGNTDEVVEMYLDGALESSGVNCDHHDHEHHHEESHECGGGCGGGCGDDLFEEESCGGCGGGCGGCSGCGPSLPEIEGKNVGKMCKTHYRGTFDDGTQFDSSYDRGEPLEFICGVGQMIYGYDKAVADMEVGQEIDVRIEPEEAYGPSDPNAIFTIEMAQLPGSEDLNVGQQVVLQDQMGRPFQVTVTEKTDTTITFDANSEMAGKVLNFHIELVEVNDL